MFHKPCCLSCELLYLLILISSLKTESKIGIFLNKHKTANIQVQQSKLDNSINFFIGGTMTTKMVYLGQFIFAQFFFVLCVFLSAVMNNAINTSGTLIRSDLLF